MMSSSTNGLGETAIDFADMVHIERIRYISLLYTYNAVLMLSVDADIRANQPSSGQFQ